MKRPAVGSQIYTGPYQHVDHNGHIPLDHTFPSAQEINFGTRAHRFRIK